MTLEPPPASGQKPPERAMVAGELVELVPLAEEICARYRAEFPDERERYGEAGIAWCVHDNRHILNWACEAIAFGADFTANLLWLRRVLAARDFPVDRLVRDLEIAADVVAESLPGEELPRRLLEGARIVAEATA